MGLKAAIQALKRAEKLKEKVQSSKDLLNDSDAWVCQQQLQRIYQQVLILDLEYALDKKVEQELWNHGFKNYIGTLQNLAKDKKNPKRNESQAMLSWCLEAASGFYLTLLQEICTAFDLDLPFRRKGSVYGNSKLWRTVDHLNQPHKSSCYYICQHCLVHLGDIARYRSQSRQAEAFYRHAVQLAPNSGQPYNQLALLEASRGDRLSTVFHYVRSVAVRHFFPAAATNLSRTFSKVTEEHLNIEGRNKLSVSEYVAVFLKLHGLLHNGADLQLAEKYVKVLTTTLTAHVATESLTSWKLVQMLAINLFALHQAGSCLDVDKVMAFADEQLSNDERKVKHLVMDLMAGSLSAYLLPVYTLKEGDTLLEYFALPAIKLTLDWIRLDPKVLTDSAFTSRLQIWPSLCKLLNGLQQALADFTADKYSYLPLPEDRDLQGFIPLEKAFSDLRFSCQDWKMDPVSLNKLRASRVLEFGNWLAKQEHYCLLTKKSSEDSVGEFEAVGGQQVPTSDLIRELEELSLTKLPSPAPSDTSSWGSTATGTSTPDNSLIIGAILGEPQVHRDIIIEQPHVEPVLEKRAGILKPQGSLEKAREKDSNGEGNWNQNMAVKRSRQNVAMQAIMRKSVMLGEQENAKNLEAKQVTFKTPSPSISPGSPQAIEENHTSIPNSMQSWQQQQPPQQKQPQLAALSMSFPYQNNQQQQQQQQQQQTAPQPPPLLQQHVQSARQQPLFDTADMLGAIHHNSTFAPQLSAFSNQIPFSQPPPPHTSNGANLSIGDNNPSRNINLGNAYPPQQHQSYGMKLRQPPFSPWQQQEENPPLPPQPWWGSDRTRQSQQDESPQNPLQMNLSFSALNYLQGSLLQQPPPPIQQRISMKSPTEIMPEPFGTGNWHSRPQMSAPPPNLNMNLNLQHKLANSAASMHRAGNYTPPVNTQSNISRPLQSNSNYPLSQPRHEPPQMSMFGSSDILRLNSDMASEKEAENSTIFSNTAPSSSSTSSFSALGLGTSTYSLFSTPNWANTATTCGRELDSNSCSNGLSAVMGVTGQQSLWSGPGPSPLERLLEQQKQLREGPAPKGGT